MASAARRHVAILGAGPAGLAAAACLRALGVGHTLVERGPEVAAALRLVDPEMALLSPTALSRLPGMRAAAGEPAYLTFRELVARLERYREEQGIEVQTGTEAVRVRREGAGFVVELRDAGGAARELRASHVVNATGIIGAPALPADFAPAAAELAWKHSLHVRDADLRTAHRLLLVGGGASAAEVLERWLEVRPPDSRAWISLRSRLMAVPHRVLGVDVHWLSWLPEQLPAWRLGPRAAALPEPMLGNAARRALRTGAASLAGPVERYAGALVHTARGGPLRPDLVVFATGFRYETRHLDGLLDRSADGRPRLRACESTRAPGLYLLGYRFGRTFASPYLRGIARDAVRVARRIASQEPA
ncbi:MAG TPA: NAD(P)-binding domain-containing protein [Longimicrobium sp.]|nr:NAD(P)-binding domain-containing protein [Longimicrobium sp.]